MKHLYTFENLNYNKQKYIDSLLDKISKHGIESLTDIEKDNLDNIENDEYEEKTERSEMIKYISQKVSDNDGTLTMGQLEADASPLYKGTAQEIHLIEVLDDLSCEVVVYGGYKYETVLNEYTVEYSELDDQTLSTICDIIESSYYFED